MAGPGGGIGALTGWALGGVAEALASATVVWRFTGSRTLSHTAERRAQRVVALSFWLTAPYIAAESVRDLADGHHAHVSVIGIWLTAIGLMLMPLLGWANHKLGAALDSEATAGEGTQNYLCALQAAGVLTGLAITASWPGGWWVEPAIGLAIAGLAVAEGFRSWRGQRPLLRLAHGQVRAGGYYSMSGDTHTLHCSALMFAVNVAHRASASPSGARPGLTRPTPAWIVEEPRLYPDVWSAAQPLSTVRPRSTGLSLRHNGNHRVASYVSTEKRRHGDGYWKAGPRNDC